ncbi:MULTISPECIES: aspartate aminotransferase family protein [unclassified Lysinibacillus]|uniref:aspartate aminotransferase family protein n=1 Tax=unclassified Lysinibacillus TaxID=2636778 RepID=UPI002011BB92|nr:MULTISPECIES: aspartate aminotransferase family protein [unclassified Lysinibacillus]MCL1697585.1 aspartate aminotransferase family protein [Lysinibacillus sp. BPa_S21]MCL1699763.1 aspartate aminotransferase family protein [Lysinibacillus sp. Bpr_S20]
MVQVNLKNDILKKDEQYVWHSMKPYNPQATYVVEKSNGARIVDTDGVEYIDAMAGLWCVNVGYGRKELADVAHEQMMKNAYAPLSQGHLPAVELAEKINEMLGGDYVIFFSNSGSEANETAFKIARQYHQQKGESSRYKIVSRYRAYHGNSFGALAATGQAERKYKYEPLAPGFVHVAPPDQYREHESETLAPTDLASVKAVDKTMTWELSETIAAMILEPIITGGGVIMPPENYLKGIEEVCKKHGALMIVDEVICGFGRTGKPFGFMNYGVKPDIITMAKGITSAYLPLSATAVKREIYEAFTGSDAYGYFRHVNTFGGSPVACAVALKNIEILQQEALFERSTEVGATTLQALQKALGTHPNVGDVRGKGLLIGIELVTDKTSKEPLPVDKVNAVIAACKEQGVIIGKNGATVAGFNNVLTLSPPLNIVQEDLDTILKVVIDNIRKVEL